MYRATETVTAWNILACGRRRRSKANTAARITGADQMTGRNWIIAVMMMMTSSPTDQLLKQATE